MFPKKLDCRTCTADWDTLLHSPINNWMPESLHGQLLFACALIAKQSPLNFY